MSTNCTAAEFRCDTNADGSLRIIADGSWLGPDRGWSFDQVKGRIYQELESLEDVAKLDILNVITCSVRTNPGREHLVTGLESGKTLQTNWYWDQISPNAKAGTLVLGKTQVTGRLPHKHSLLLTGKDAPTNDGTRPVCVISLTQEHNDMISGKIPCTSFFLRVRKLDAQDPIVELYPRNSHGTPKPVSTLVQAVGRIDQPSMAHVEYFGALKEGLSHMTKFGDKQSLSITVDKRIHQGGITYAKLSGGDWIHHSTST
jgi:hypothetical protein